MESNISPSLSPTYRLSPGEITHLDNLAKEDRIFGSIMKTVQRGQSPPKPPVSYERNHNDQGLVKLPITQGSRDEEKPTSVNNKPSRRVPGNGVTTKAQSPKTHQVPQTPLPIIRRTNSSLPPGVVTRAKARHMASSLLTPESTPTRLSNNGGVSKPKQPRSILAKKLSGKENSPLKVVRFDQVVAEIGQVQTTNDNIAPQRRSARVMGREASLIRPLKEGARSTIEEASLVPKARKGAARSTIKEASLARKAKKESVRKARKESTQPTAAAESNENNVASAILEETNTGNNASPVAHESAAENIEPAIAGEPEAEYHEYLVLCEPRIRGGRIMGGDPSAIRKAAMASAQFVIAEESSTESGDESRELTAVGDAMDEDCIVVKGDEADYEIVDEEDGLVEEAEDSMEEDTAEELIDEEQVLIDQAGEEAHEDDSFEDSMEVDEDPSVTEGKEEDDSTISTVGSAAWSITAEVGSTIGGGGSEDRSVSVEVKDEDRSTISAVGSEDGSVPRSDMSGRSFRSIEPGSIKQSIEMDVKAEVGASCPHNVLSRGISSASNETIKKEDGETFVGDGAGSDWVKAESEATPARDTPSSTGSMASRLFSFMSGGRRLSWF